MKVTVDDIWGNHDELELEPNLTLRQLLENMPTKARFSPIDPQTGEIYAFLQLLVNGLDSYLLPQQMDTPLQDGDKLEITVMAVGGG